jgi:hypothetical protein
MAYDLTVEQFHKALPKGMRNNASQQLVDSINKIQSNSIEKEAYRENLLSYTNVMRDGRFQIVKYLEAVKYVTHKLLGDSNIQAYVKTFPDRYQKFLANGTESKDIASYVTSYNKNKLVNLIFEQTLVPSHILNAALYQDALNVQAALMNDEYVSPKVRSDAANSLLTHLKMPETTKIELDISVKEDSVIDELRKTTLALAKKQREMLESGTMKTIEVAESAILIEGECEVG